MYGSSLAELTETLETKDAVCKSIQSVIAADAYVEAGMDVGAALSVKDIAGLNKLAVCSLGTKTLGIGITAVLGGAHSLFMREELKIEIHHGSFLLEMNNEILPAVCFPDAV